MTPEQIDGILDRVRDWPPERQQEAMEILLVLEQKNLGLYRMSDDERADIREAIAEMERGEIASEEEVSATFARLRR